MSDPVISFSGVRKIFSTGRQPVLAVDDLSFAVFRGEYTCVLGRSGSGKSTAVNLLLGLTAPTAGRISIFGVDPLRDFARLRGRLATVFQSDRLLPWRTAIDNVRLPLEILGIDEAALPVPPRDWLGRLGLAGFERAYPQELSGGMRQRVSLARALAANPDIVIADEAFAHLDEVTGERLRQDFHKLSKKEGKTVVHITHSIDEALSLADRIIVVGKPGRVIADISDVRTLVATGREPLRSKILARLQGPNGVRSERSAEVVQWAV